MATNRRWETVPQEYQANAYRKWKDRYRTVNVAMSPLPADRMAPDGFPVDASGARLPGFFDAEHAVEELGKVINENNPGMNERGRNALIAAELQSLYNERQQSMQPGIQRADGPDLARLQILRDAEKASVAEHLARLQRAPNADALGEAAKDRFAELQAFDYRFNHPIANPDRNLVEAPLTDQDRVNWLRGRDGQEYGDRSVPQGATYEQDETEMLLYTGESSRKGVAIRTVEPLPRPEVHVDISVRDAMRVDAEQAQQALEDAKKLAAERSKDMAPVFIPNEFEPEPFKPEADFRDRASDEGERYYRGTLVGTGTHPIDPADPSKVSPYAEIQGRNGETHIVNGVDVPKAIARAGLSVGDVIELRQIEQQSVQTPGSTQQRVRNTWNAQEHDFNEHDQDQREDHAIREADRLAEHEKVEGERFATFKVESEAYKQRHPSENQVLNRFTELSNAPVAEKLDAMGDPIARRETRAGRKLDAMLGRARPEQAPTPEHAPAQVQDAKRGIAGEVDRLRAERDQRLGLGQAGAVPAVPEEADSHVQAHAQHKSDQQVLSDTLNDAGQSVRTGFSNDHKTVYFDMKVGEHAVRGQAPWNPEKVELGQQKPPTAIDAFANGGRLEQALGHPVNEETRGFVKDALNEYVQGSAVRTIERDGYVVGMPQLPDRQGLAAKLDARNGVEPPVEQDTGSQRQGQGAAIAPTVSEQPKVEQAAPVVAQAPQESAAVRPNLPNLSAIGERVEARQADAQPAPTPSVSDAVQPTVEHAAPVEQTAGVKVPNLAALGERVDASQVPTPAVEQPVHAERVKVEQPAPVVEQAQQPVRPNLPSLDGIGQRVDDREVQAMQPTVQPAVTPQAPAQAAEQPKVEKNAQQVAQPAPEQAPVQNRMPANLPDRSAIVAKMNDDVQAHNAATVPLLRATSSSIDQLNASSRALEKQLEQVQKQEQAPAQLVAKGQEQGIRYRLQQNL
ncbi:hypothetical protein [Burkholderia glumae]|uniref:hypothetical protein n=1 Tax=Burkholderia glumae TaxID=337 RepID=UPI00214FD911|nr:hypothetical protein [Burkholderia glumae]